MRIIVYKGKIGSAEDGSREVVCVEDIQGFWELVKGLHYDEKVDSVMIGMDLVEKDTLALDVWLR